MNIVETKTQLDSLTSRILETYTELDSKLQSIQLSNVSEVQRVVSEKESLCEALKQKQTEIDSLKQSLASETNKVQEYKQQLTQLQKSPPIEEETSENKFDMVRLQAKEITAKDKEIMRLTKEIARLKELNEVKSSVTMKVSETSIEGWSPTSSTTPQPRQEPDPISLSDTESKPGVDEVEEVDDVDEVDEVDEPVNVPEVDDVVDEPVDDAESDEESIDEFFPIVYRKVNYYRDSNNKVYEIVGDDEPGNCIGDWVKDGKYKSGNDKYKVVKY